MLVPSNWAADEASRRLYMRTELSCRFASYSSIHPLLRGSRLLRWMQTLSDAFHFWSVKGTNLRRGTDQTLRIVAAGCG